MANLIYLLAIFVLTFEVITALSILAPPADDISVNYCDPSQCPRCPVPACNCPNQPVVADVTDTTASSQPAQTLDEQPSAAVEPTTQLYKPKQFPRPYPFPRPIPFPRPRPCVCPPCPQIKIQCLCQL